MTTFDSTQESTLVDGTGPGSLSYVLDFDHVIALSAAGVISDAPAGVYAPECYEPAPDSIDAGDGWELITSGLTGQYGYNGPWLHDSEVIAGGVARRVLDHASDHDGGLYVAVYASYSCEECGGAGLVWNEDATGEVECPAACEPGTTLEGWAIAYRPANASLDGR